MKKSLLHKTFLLTVLYALLVLAASVPAYYYLVDRIWLAELDEHNQIIAARIENELNALELTEEELAESITLWNKIQPGTDLRPLSTDATTADSVYTVLKQNPYAAQTDIDRFRGLSKIIHLNGSPYVLMVETNVEETEETVVAIAGVTFLFFLILVTGLLLLNRRLSRTLWKPFRNTLSMLKKFHLSSQTPIEFDKTNTLEFEALHDALRKLIAQNIAAYNSQKEFTENASHELQTPLAIIKNKLDLLLQKESLSDRQYQLIEEANRALTRVARINKNLLLLAKIENSQFEATETLDLSALLTQSLALLDEHFDHKHIRLQTSIGNPVMLTGNRTLVEILVHNLLLNAIRHSNEYGTVHISLDKKALIVSNSGSAALEETSLFKRFSSVSDTSAGTGLGLNIIRQVCNRHGWNITYRFEKNMHVFSVAF